MTEADRLRSLESQLRHCTGSLAPFCQFLAAFLVALLAQRTLSLAWIAQAMPTSAQPESNRKRIQRFLEDRRVTAGYVTDCVALICRPCQRF